MTQLLNYAYQPHSNQKVIFDKLLPFRRINSNNYGCQFSSQTSINQDIENQQQFYEQIIHLHYKEYWNYKIMLKVHPYKCHFNVQVKIINPKGFVLKVMSQYHRTFLYRRFLIKKSNIIAKINPSSGELSFCLPFFLNKRQTQQFSELNFQSLQELIMEEKIMFQQIINLVQNNQHTTQFSQHEQTKTFVGFCVKKSQLQKKSSIKHYFQKRKQFKSRTYDGCGEIKVQKSSSHEVKQILNYLVNPLIKIDQVNQSRQNLFIRPETKRIMHNVQQSLIKSNSTLKTFRKINFSKKGTQHLITSITDMMEKRESHKIQRVQSSSFGSFPLLVKIQRISIVERTYKLLSNFPQNLQFSFLNNYLKCNSLESKFDNNVILQFAVHRQQLINYLQTNNQSISFSTKLRILSQIISATYLLQNKCSILVADLGFSNFSVTKNVTLKINRIQSFTKVDECQKIDLSPEINLKNVQNQMNIGRMYSKLFYKKDILYFKPSKNIKRLRLSQVCQNKYDQKQIVIDKLYEQCGYYGPKQLMCLLSCIFIPYIPVTPYNQIKKNPISRNLKWSISSLVKIMEKIC